MKDKPVDVRIDKRTLFLISTILLIVVALILAVYTVSNRKTSVISNSGFEKLDKSGKPILWNESYIGGWFVDESETYEGERCMRTTKGWSWLSQEIPVRQKKYYTLRIYVKSDIIRDGKIERGNTFLTLESLNENNEVIKREWNICTSTTSWELKEKSIYAPQGTAKIRIKLAKRLGQGSVWFDGIKLQESKLLIMNDFVFYSLICLTLGLLVFIPVRIVLRPCDSKKPRYKFRIDRKLLLLILIILIAFILRVYGLSHGLPYYHQDEQVIVKPAVHFLTGDLNPHRFDYPSLSMYIVGGVYSIYFFIGHYFGQFRSIWDFSEFFRTNPGNFYLIARLVSVFLGTATIALIYIIGTKIFNKKAGLFAALFLAFSVEHVAQSHKILPHVPHAFFVTLAFLFIWLCYKTGKRKYYLLAGLCIGLGAATLYLAVFLILPFLIAHIMRVWENRQSIRNPFWNIQNIWLLIGVAFVGLGWFIGCPYSILDFRTFLHWFEAMSTGAGRPIIDSFSYWLSMPLWINYSKVLGHLVGKYGVYVLVGSIIYGLYKHTKKTVFLILFPSLLFLVMAAWTYRPPRYFLSALPFFALFIGQLVDTVSSKISSISSFLKNRQILVGVGILLVIFLGTAIRDIIIVDYLFGQKSTKIIAAEWIEENIPEGAKIAMEYGGPRIFPRKWAIEYYEYLSQKDITWYKNHNYDYLIVSEVWSHVSSRKGAEFYKWLSDPLNSNVTHIKSFQRKPPLDYKGKAEYFRLQYLTIVHPPIHIYKLNASP